MLNSCYTNNEIEELAEGVIRQYLGSQRQIPLNVDIDGFTTDYLGLPVEYHTFAEADYGKVAFISDGITSLRILTENGPAPRLFPKGTVVLERYLLLPKEEPRRRFSLAHEDSHYIMDRTITVASFRREYDNERTYSPQELRNLLSFRETQVDRLAAALLMPRFMVRNILSRFAGRDLIPIYGDSLLRLEDKLLVRKMADIMGVSYTAFLIRLKELNLLERHDVSEYIVREIGLGGNVMCP